MAKDKALPPRVFPKGRWFYLVTPNGKKRVWTKLTLIRSGLPDLYRKLADMHARDVAPGRIPALVADWLLEVATRHTKKTLASDKWVMNAIAKAFAEFVARDVTPVDGSAFLDEFRDKPRTHNAMRAGLRELMRYAEQKGERDAGTNPIDCIPTMQIVKRDRYLTDSEIRRIKHAALVGADGLRTRSGPMVCAAIDLAYLTGQRVGDLLELRRNKRVALDKDGKLEAPFVDVDGIHFKPSKTSRKTAAKVLITWTPALRALLERIENIGRLNLKWVITTQEAQPYTYDGFASAWERAVKRAGIVDAHFHDIRAKALTDKEAAGGMQAARRMGAHSTEAQTADYVRHRTAQRTEATR